MSGVRCGRRRQGQLIRPGSTETLEWGWTCSVVYSGRGGALVEMGDQPYGKKTRRVFSRIGGGPMWWR